VRKCWDTEEPRLGGEVDIDEIQHQTGTGDFRSSRTNSDSALSRDLAEKIRVGTQIPTQPPPVQTVVWVRTQEAGRE
jgi:hypothetical protein